MNKQEELPAGKTELFTRDEVLEIVDACFHAYASSFRHEVEEYANEMMESYRKQRRIE